MEIEDHTLSIDIVDHDRQIERLMNYTRLKGPHLEEVATMGKAHFKHEMAQPRDSYESAERVNASCKWRVASSSALSLCV